MLLERGARVNAHDNRLGRTPLHWAVGKRNIQGVRLLLEHGADVNALDKLGRTPSQLGSELNADEIVELLSKYGSGSIK
jgi:ankyrin repeat protein